MLAVAIRALARRSTRALAVATAVSLAVVAVAAPASADTSASVALTGFPRSVIVDSSYYEFTLAIDNPGAATPNARVDVDLTGTSDMAGSDVRLQFESGIWVGPSLQGTADGAGGMTGYLGQPSGFTLQSGKTSYVMRLAFVAGTPADTLTTTFDVDSLDPATDSPMSTLTGVHGKTEVIPKSTPVAPDQAVTATSGVATDITLAPTDADGWYPSATHTDPTIGTLTQKSSEGTVLSYTAPSDFTGTDSFTYTAYGPSSELQTEDPPSDTGTVTITVKSPTQVSSTITPARLMVGQRPRLMVRATSAGSVDGGQVTVEGLAKPMLGSLAGGSASFTLPAVSAGSHSISVIYGGTSSTQTASTTLKETAARYASHVGATLNPRRVSTDTAHPQVVTTVSVQGGSSEGGKISIFSGEHRLGRASVRSGRALVRLAHLSAGHHTLRVLFSGTTTTLPASAVIRRTVQRG